ncbi:MAG: bifunctional nuclease family protein [Candidatus Aenigmarchaeota archaeon]|nr:bifunctional nuclease family protein [Candidatus Aenigmarchaeota archaeon]
MTKFHAIMIILIIVAFAAGIAIGTRYYKIPQIEKALQEITPSSSYDVDNTGFVVANVSLDGVNIGLRNDCYGINFDITIDQAYSIGRSLLNEPSARPLTHDIFRDLLDGFNVSIRAIRIERYGDEIYYARMFVQSGNKVLDIDMRPSDAIALSLRTKNNLLINETMLKERGINLCNI